VKTFLWYPPEYPHCVLRDLGYRIPSNKGLVVFRSRVVWIFGMTQQCRIDVCVFDSTKDSRNSDK
jgi:hypothetical protein